MIVCRATAYVYVNYVLGILCVCDWEGGRGVSSLPCLCAPVTSAFS